MFRLSSKVTNLITKLTKPRPYGVAVTKATVNEISNNKESFKIGDVHHGFKVTNIQSIPEFSVEATHFIHEKTKAEYLHLYRDDANNVFSINFRTTPLDNSGKPHILEHTVLCGSENFPVRDPFFKMLNRSLATFMNAMTAPDYTMYPFSTTNEKDYRNLQAVYLDAVFKPKIKLLDFMQEGWRLEQADLENPNSEMVIKGVVYNEMKGVLAENDRLIGEKILNLLLPDHTYGVISGGNPPDIPSLTWEGLKEFHKVHYHPSNSRFYSYGNFPLLPTLKFVNEKYLEGYNSSNVEHTKVPSQLRWNKYREASIDGRVNEMATGVQSSIVVAYLMNDISNIYDSLVMQFVSQLLMKGPNSPFYKSLIEPNFSGGYHSCSGYDNQVKDTIFALGLQGIKPTDFDKFIQLFDETIDKVIKEGFSKEQIETVLHGYELGIKHESSNFGLRLLFGLSPVWNHNADILQSLKVNDLIDRLKNDMHKNPQFLQSVMKDTFKNNKHRLVIKMIPDQGYDKKLLEEESRVLADKVKKLDDAKRIELFKLGKELEAEQKKPHNTNLLPTLKLEDIKETGNVTEFSKYYYDNIPVQICDAPTNGITYLKMLFDTSQLKDYDHRMLVPLFNSIVTKLGTNNYNYQEFDTLVNKKTSGLSISSHIVENIYNIDEFQEGLALSSYCLDENLDDMLKIWQELFEFNKYDDVKRFEMLTNMYVTNLTNGIIDSGHLYAMQAANSLISGSGYKRETLGGLAHIKYMKILLKNLTYPEILTKLKEMSQLIFSKQNLRVAANCLPTKHNDVVKKLEKFAINLPGSPNSETVKPIFKTAEIFDGLHMTECKHYILNIPVNFAAKSIKTVPYVHDEFAELRILARYITAKYLFPVIREQNGAYGCGAKLSSTGLFDFFSYRDPKGFNSLDTFDQSHDYLKKNFENISEQDVFEAKLNIFQSLDAPITPGARGNLLFYNELTDEIIQKHRIKLLNVTKNDMLKVSEKYLTDITKAKVSKTMLGPEACLDKRKDCEHWTVEKD